MIDPSPTSLSAVFSPSPCTLRSWSSPPPRPCCRRRTRRFLADRGALAALTRGDSKGRLQTRSSGGISTALCWKCSTSQLAANPKLALFQGEIPFPAPFRASCQKPCLVHVIHRLSKPGWRAADAVPYSDFSALSHPSLAQRALVLFLLLLLLLVSVLVTLCSSHRTNCSEHR